MNSAIASKINWTQVVSVIAMVATMFGFDFPAETQAAIVSVIVALNGAITMIWRTWFTKPV
jgi:hypothetical protein